MKKVLFALLIISFFACKKEGTKVSNQTIDSTVYYGKWTKMNKVPLQLVNDITDLSYQPNKIMALLTDSRVIFIDSNFNVNLSSKFYYNLRNFNMKFQTSEESTKLKNRFFYTTYPRAAAGKESQLVIENLVSGSELNTQIYNLNSFIKDTNTNNSYNYIGYGEDYFAYKIYTSVSNLHNYQLRYYNFSKSIDTTISFSSNIQFNNTFRINDNVVFWKFEDNSLVIVNTNMMSIQENVSFSNDFRFLGTFKNYAYFKSVNFFNQGIFKTNNFIDFQLVYKSELMGQPLPYFNEKHLLIDKYNNSNSGLKTDLIILNIESNTSQIISMPFEKYETVKCNWIIDNVLYILTQDNVYARKL